MLITPKVQPFAFGTSACPPSWLNCRKSGYLLFGMYQHSLRCLFSAECVDE